jgi:protoheme IX farnesyltransferase
MTTLTTPPIDVVPTLQTIAPAQRQSARGFVRTYMELTKARLSALVLVTTAVGYIMASEAVHLGGNRGVNWLGMFWTMLGTALAAGCANALNQIVEINLDRRMFRTASRPLPSGVMGVSHGFVVALMMGAAGLAVLTLQVNLAAAWLALATILLYVIVYTPLKTRSTLNTIVGAICGAIPPVIGWVAADGSLQSGALILAAILFVWQIPHFFALAWVYRHDYARGGFVMLPVIDRTGQITCQVIVLTSMCLIPLAPLATLQNLAGAYYAFGSMALGVWMLWLAVRLYVKRTDASARGLFLASIAYLPILLCLMVLDRGPL